MILTKQIISRNFLSNDFIYILQYPFSKIEEFKKNIFITKIIKRGNAQMDEINEFEDKGIEETSLEDLDFLDED